MSSAEVELLLFLMDEAFEANEEHSLMGNLRTVSEDDWLWVPPLGRRRIGDIVWHVGGAKYMYDNHAFGDARMTWDNPFLAPPPDQQATMIEAIQWMREGHRRLREHIAALGEDDLSRRRLTHWGELRETRWIVSVMNRA